MKYEKKPVQMEKADQSRIEVTGKTGGAEQFGMEMTGKTRGAENLTILITNHRLNGQNFLRWV